MEGLIYKQIWETVKLAKHPLLISHKKPDGDTLGAMLGFAGALAQAGITHTKFCIDAIPTPYQFMSGSIEVVSNEQEVLRRNPDALVLFDAGDLIFAGVDALVKKIQPRPTIINIDHHHTNARFGDINAVVTDAASTTEVVHRLLAANNISIDAGISTCLLAGLCTDTGNFSNPATTSSAIRLGAELLSRGAKFSSVFRALWKNKTLSSLKLWGLALERIRYDEKEGIATTVLFLKDLAEHGGDEEAVEGISNFLSATLDVPVVLVLRELPDGNVKGSYRTTTARDVSALAAAYGGGGHKKAAGFTVSGIIEETPNEWKIIRNNQSPNQNNEY